MSQADSPIPSVSAPCLLRVCSVSAPWKHERNTKGIRRGYEGDTKGMEKCSWVDNNPSAGALVKMR